MEIKSAITLPRTLVLFVCLYSLSENLVEIPVQLSQAKCFHVGTQNEKSHFLVLVCIISRVITFRRGPESLQMLSDRVLQAHPR